MNISTQSMGSNIFDSISLGTVQGVKLAVNVGAMILVFVAFISLLNEILNLFGYYTGINDAIESSNSIYSSSHSYIHIHSRILVSLIYS